MVCLRSGGVLPRLAAALMAGTAVSVVTTQSAIAQSSSVSQPSLSIAAQPLAKALIAFSKQTGIEVVVPSAAAAGKRSTAVSGSLAPETALQQLLSGTGLTFSFNGSTFSVNDPNAAGNAAGATIEGAIPLDTIDVSGGGVPSVYQPYETAGPAAYISQETIERFRGSSPADMFRGTPGVMSGEARNGAGSVDVNIRGMQGMGRVAVTIDGASNATTVYQGYQGVSNRSFVDPDLLAGIDITKGSDAASNGIAGTVAMRTLDAADIVKPGKNVGIRIKGGVGTNTSEPPPATTVGGYSFPTFPWSTQVATSTSDGMDRPGIFEPTSGSGSVAAAVKEENFDAIAAYAYRKQGNYHAGTNGPVAKPVNVGERLQVPNSAGILQDWPEYIDNAGIANVRAGEEVLNTQLETESWIVKGTARLDDGHALQLGYTGFRSEAGDLLASRLTHDRLQSSQQKLTSGTKLDTGTLRYRWNPADSDLIDVKANAWVSTLEMRQARRNIATSAAIRDLLAVLPANFRTGTDTKMWGTDVTNTSKLDIGRGPVELTYGASWLSEDTEPSLHTKVLESTFSPRDGTREEAAAFAKASWKAEEWLTLNGGLRYQHFWSKDRSDRTSLSTGAQPLHIAGFSQTGDGFSPFVGVTLEPLEGTQIYVNYSNAMRAPSIMEATTTFGMAVNAAVEPERSSNWELGVNLTRNGVLTGDDRGMVKLGYFDWDVHNYIARTFVMDTTRYGMLIYNIDRAHFSGLELSGRYELNGFTAELAANYYTDVTFCQTAASCGSKSLYADYATNQVPPEYSIDVTLSQKFLNDALTVGGRFSYVGPRAIGHNPVTMQGASQFIMLTDWQPYALVDAFAEYKIDETLTADIRVMNLTDTYYVDPLSLVQQPAPGRTIGVSLTKTF